MRFRHLLRHTCGYELVRDELRRLVESPPAVLAEPKDRRQPFL
jgi:hypothetical protein